ncbi:MAG TPA: hypothetical protein VF185_04470 [Patescibacteria group bacterium]
MKDRLPEMYGGQKQDNSSDLLKRQKVDIGILGASALALVTSLAAGGTSASTKDQLLLLSSAGSIFVGSSAAFLAIINDPKTRQTVDKLVDRFISSTDNKKY